MRLKHESTQWEFGFINALPAVRRAVLRLRRYCRGGWDAKVHEVSYSDWLEFYTPLCSRGQGGEL